ncbi:MAG: PrsW family intramembrane metalloprotease [Spirochaetaceae bacterium]|jgi:hypothetical protein|nr:PrsW family intramembrane metalloprotease [Spirochaetaceae bacterium]
MLLILLVSAAPLCAVLIWFHAAGMPVKTRFFLISLAAGACAMFASAAAQYLFFLYIPSAPALFSIFVRTALVEEAGRFAVFALVFAAARKAAGSFLTERFACCAGLVSSLSFSCLENVYYALMSPSSVLVRVVTAVPLHAACAMRSVSAAYFLKENRKRAAVIFFQAVFIHGFYDYFISASGFLQFLAPVLAITAFFSKAVFISQKEEF